MSQPDNAYRPAFVAGSAAAGGQLQWTTQENGQIRVYQREPAPNPWRRLLVTILSWLPVRREL